MDSKIIIEDIENPFRPGAGHMPPYLAGRDEETKEFRHLLGQRTILQNLILTGLRGVGKTVLLETFRPIAVQQDWLWVGTDMSESSSVSEDLIATRLLADLSVATSLLPANHSHLRRFGIQANVGTLSFDTLRQIFDRVPGLISDKLKAILEIAWSAVNKENRKGLIFAYDEAQNLSDHVSKEQFPLSLLLDVFQSLQRKAIPIMLVLTGLPTLFPKLVEARTFAERMFHVMFLRRLSEDASRQAILIPIQNSRCAFVIDDESVQTITYMSDGYPYFIQFICREVYDVWIQKIRSGKKPVVPPEEIIRKLDTNFFAGRWARATDRQRELLTVAATLVGAYSEFTVQELVGRSKEMLTKSFSSSHANQMLASLGEAGLVYKDRHGKYLFAVPLLDKFILRQGMVQHL
jgi:hypothetical protein